MTFSLSAAIKVVEAHKDELDLQPNLHKEYIDNLKEIEKRTNEDYRQANAIAVDAGKTIFALATAAFVAVGAFVQHGLSQGSMLFDRPIIALGLASVALIYCVFEGVIVISLAYRRGSGVQEFKEWKIYHHWSVQPLRRHLFRQFAAGALGCFLLASAVILYGVSPRPAVMTTAEGLRMGLTEMGRGLESLETNSVLSVPSARAHWASWTSWS